MGGKKQWGKHAKESTSYPAGKSAKYLTCAHSFHWPDPWQKKIKDRRTPTSLGNSFWGSAESAFGTYRGAASPESLNGAHCHSPVHGEFKETRNERL